MGWKEYLEQNCANYKNFVLLGEAGSGKSEIALNLAAHLAQCQPLPVHFFDLDMTKPLFRSRDLAEEMEALGVHFHFEKQFMDAPTQVGGVNRLLRDPKCCVVMDVGGDDIGARAVGADVPEFVRMQLLASLMLLLSGVLPNVSGLGSVEIAFLFVFKGFLGEVNASSVLVLYRIASYFFPFIIGVIVFMACRKKIVPEKKEA